MSEQLEPTSEGEGIFEVEWIEQKLIAEDGSISYFIRWKGFSENDNTWEPESNLECKMLLDEFETRCRLDPSLVTDLRRSKKSKDSSHKRSRDAKEVSDKKSHKKSKRSPSTPRSFTEMNFSDSWKSSSESHKYSSKSRKHSSSSWKSSSESWTSASGSWSYRLDYEKTGFDEGLTPERIIGANNASGELVFLIKWKGRVDASLVRGSVVKAKCPQMVLDFFSSRVAKINDY